MEVWYQIRNVDAIDSPALIVYSERVGMNITMAKAIVGSPGRLRPHVKTHKSKEAVLLMMENGVDRFKCATIAEAEMLATLNVPDVLLAYQPVGPKIQRLVNLTKKYPLTTFSCLVDNAYSAESIAIFAASAEINIGLFIDINCGTNRTGTIPGKKAVDLYIYCSTLKGVTVNGLHVYDGHIDDEDIGIRCKKSDEVYDELDRMKKELENEGYNVPTVIAGGSPTFPCHAKRDNVECSPGTFAYWDLGYSKRYRDLPFLPAALVITRIISKPAAGLICTDLGYKSISAENSLKNRVHFLNALDLDFVSQSEEHLVLKTMNNQPYHIGDVLYGLPFHICPTSALYERAFVVEDGFVRKEWMVTSRDRRLSI